MSRLAKAKKCLASLTAAQGRGDCVSHFKHGGKRDSLLSIHFVCPATFDCSGRLSRTTVAKCGPTAPSKRSLASVADCREALYNLCVCVCVCVPALCRLICIIRASTSFVSCPARGGVVSMQKGWFEWPQPDLHLRTEWMNC